jgi:NADPH-dependent curcumin reductase CurA
MSGAGMAQRNRQWLLARRPKGDDLDSALELVEVDTPALSDGDVLVRNAYLSLDAGTRMWMGPREDGYQPPLPVGSPFTGIVIGVVLESEHPDYREGDLVRTYGQWGDLSVVRPDDVPTERLSRRLDDLRQHLGVFGFNAWTAYAGVMDYGQAQPGETFVVSAAGGATGALAGQVAKRRGCRVIGITGSDEKCRWITEDLHFDAAINYKRVDVAEQLRSSCPEGVDLYFDNVGGPILDAVLANMALFGRVVVCGLISVYDQDAPTPGPMNFDQVLMKRLKITGFFSPDFFHRGAEINRALKPWYESGEITLPFDVGYGVENIMNSFQKMMTGGNIGKAIVQLSEI